MSNKKMIREFLIENNIRTMTFVDEPESFIEHCDLTNQVADCIKIEFTDVNGFSFEQAVNEYYIDFVDTCLHNNWKHLAA